MPIYPLSIVYELSASRYVQRPSLPPARITLDNPLSTVVVAYIAYVVRVVVVISQLQCDIINASA